jgi:hypothetical protein
MKAWTFSQLEKYQTCPKQFYHLRVIRDTEDPPTDATRWGEEVHTAFENRINEGTPLPVGMEQWEGFARKLISLQGTKYAEVELAVDNNFKPCDWNNAWSRGIVDLLIIHGSSAVVLDYKTGKRKPSHQLSLYAGYVFAHYPEVNKVTTIFAWLKDKKLDQETFTRDSVAEIWQAFLPTVRKLELAHEHNQWPARPSGLCRNWCNVLSCTHNGRS